MSLKTKTPLFIGLLIITVFTILTAIYTGIMFRGFFSIEQNLISQNITRADETMKRELEYLATKSYDWSVWDDTYTFITNNNQSYKDANMNPTALLAINVNAMAFFTNEGDMFYSYWVDADNPQATAPSSFATEITKIKTKILCASTDDHHSGILTFPEGIFYFATRPVVKSNGDGPVNGTILLGFWFGKDRIENIQKIVNLPFSIFPADKQIPNDLAPVIPTIQKDKTAIVRKNLQTIAGYGVVEDFSGQPAYYYEVDMPRSIFKQGIQSIVGLLVIEVIVCILFITVSYLIMNRLILNRLSSLTYWVTQIGKQEKPITQIPSDTTGDEISTLNQSINTMLVSLSQSRAIIEEEQKKSQQKTKDLEELNQTMIGREVKMVELKEELAKVTKELEERKKQ